MHPTAGYERPTAVSAPPKPQDTCAGAALRMWPCRYEAVPAASQLSHTGKPLGSTANIAHLGSWADCRALKQLSQGQVTGKAAPLAAQCTQPQNWSRYDATSGVGLSRNRIHSQQKDYGRLSVHPQHRSSERTTAQQKEFATTGFHGYPRVLRRVATLRQRRASLLGSPNQPNQIGTMRTRLFKHQSFVAGPRGGQLSTA